MCYPLDACTQSSQEGSRVIDTNVFCGGRGSLRIVVFFVLHLDKVAFGGSIAARRLALAMGPSVDGVLIS